MAGQLFHRAHHQNHPAQSQGVPGKDPQLVGGDQIVHQLDGGQPGDGRHHYPHQQGQGEEGLPRGNAVGQIQKVGPQHRGNPHDKGEGHGVGPVQPAQEPHRQGGAGAGDARHGGKGLGHPHGQGVPRGHGGGLFVALGASVGQPQQAAGHQEAEALHHDAVVRREACHRVLEKQHDKQRQDGEDQQQDHPPPAVHLPEGEPPLCNLPHHGKKFPDQAQDGGPEGDEYRYQGAEMEHHRKGDRTVRAAAGKILEEGQVSRAGDGQKLGKSLDQPLENRF